MPKRKPQLPANPPAALASSREAGGGKSHQPKRKKKEEEELRQSDAKVSALLDETSSGALAPALSGAAASADSLTAVERLDRIVNHAHDELDLLLLDARAKSTEKGILPNRAAVEAEG